MRTEAEQQGEEGFSDRFCIGVFAAVFLTLNTWSWGRFLLRPAVDIFPLMWPFDRFQDLLNYQGKMLHLNRGAAVLGTGKPVFNYPAPAAFLFHWFLNTPDPPLYLAVVVLGSFVTLLAAAAVLLYRKGLLGWPGILGLAVPASSYPMMFVIYRANFEGIVWLLTTGSLCLLLRRRYLASSVLLGLAMSIKPFPGLLLLLFLARRQYRAVLVSLGVAAGVVLAALAAIGPSVVKAYRGLQPGVALYTHDYVLTFRPSIEQEYSHGVIDVLRVLYLKYVWFTQRVPPQQLFLHPTPSIFPMLYVGFILCLATFMVVRLRSMPAANQVLGAGTALTLLPPSAGDYTLCSLYLPVLLIGFFLLTEVRSHREVFGLRHLILLVIPCAFLLSPMNVFGFWVSVWRFLLLLLLTWAATTLPMRMAVLDQWEPARPNRLRKA